jgi:hypothetical protein
LCVDSAFVFLRYATVMTEGQPLPTGEGMKPAFEYEGDLSVLSDIQNLAESGTRQAGLFVLGGLMRSASGMAQLTEFEKRGMSGAFKYAVGMSAGVLGASYFLAGRMQQAQSDTLDVCCDRTDGRPNFITRNGGGLPKVSTRMLRDLWERKDASGISFDALPRDAELSVVVARAGTHEPITVKVGPDTIYDAMQASVALGKFTEGPVQVSLPGGTTELCEDAVPYAPMPFEHVLLQYQNVNPIVVVANAPKSLNGLTKAEKQHFDTGIAELKRYCNDNGKKYLVLYAHEDLNALDNARGTVDAVMSHVTQHMRYLINSTP